MKKELIIVIVVLAIVGFGLASIFTAPKKDVLPKGNNLFQTFEKYKEITNPSGFVNVDSPITIGQYIGKKVVLIDFLTYSCINCQRTFPYINAWYEKYKDQGLEVIGIHTPEFAFEKDIDNVREAMQKFGIEHPIVLDNDYGTWRAYSNSYWPRKYLIDIHGNIVYDHIGEGNYEETEREIQKALEERAEFLGEQAVLDEELASQNITSTQTRPASPETYFGSSRNEFLANGTPGSSGLATFKLPAEFEINKLYLGGEWQIEPEYAESQLDSVVNYQFAAKDVHLVAEADNSSPIEVWIDGEFVKTVDIRESGLYTIFSDTNLEKRFLELRIKVPGVRLYAFTFG